MIRPDLCLDFANTRYWRGQDTPTETLNAPSDFAAWTKAAKPPAAKEFEQALTIRESLYRLFDAQAQGKPATPRDLETLNQAMAKAPARTFMFVESGEEALGAIANAIAAKLNLGAAQSWSADEAIATWGRNMAVFSLGSNSRVRGKAAAALGWSPTHRSITRWIVESL